MNLLLLVLMICFKEFHTFTPFFLFFPQIVLVCGGELPYDADQGGIITSPGFSEDDENSTYSHSLQCTWTLTNPNRGNSSIQILFDTFALESHGECDYDHLEIREGNNHNSFLGNSFILYFQLMLFMFFPISTTLGSTDDGQLIGRYCDNSTLPPPIASPAQSVRVRFISDYYVGDRGFKLQYFYTSKFGYEVTDAC